MKFSQDEIMFMLSLLEGFLCGAAEELMKRGFADDSGAYICQTGIEEYDQLRLTVPLAIRLMRKIALRLNDAEKREYYLKGADVAENTFRFEGFYPTSMINALERAGFFSTENNHETND